MGGGPRQFLFAHGDPPPPPVSLGARGPGVASSSPVITMPYHNHNCSQGGVWMWVGLWAGSSITAKAQRYQGVSADGPSATTPSTSLASSPGLAARLDRIASSASIPRSSCSSLMPFTPPLWVTSSSRGTSSTAILRNWAGAFFMTLAMASRPPLRKASVIASMVSRLSVLRARNRSTLPGAENPLPLFPGRYCPLALRWASALRLEACFLGLAGISRGYLISGVLG